MNTLVFTTIRHLILSNTMFAVLALILLAGVAEVQAQWTTTGTDINNTNTGNVGIGTATPSAKLHVAGSSAVGVAIEATGGAGTASLTFTNPSGSWETGTNNGGNGTNNNQYYIYQGGYRLTLQNGSGNIGIGTTSPAAKLHLSGGNGTSSPTAGATIALGYSTNGQYAHFISTVHNAGSGTANAINFYTSDGTAAGVFPTNAVLGLSITNGNVGIGTTNQAGRLHIAATTGVASPGSIALAIRDSAGPTSGFDFNLEGVSTGDMSLMRTVSGTQSQVMTFQRATGNVGIGTTNPSYKLDVNGNTNVAGNLNVTATGSGTGNIIATGTIEGGNIKAKYQDVAEWVESSQSLSAGTVVVLDQTKSNQVIASSAAYDTRVAGVISERPGIALGETGPGRVLVATTGRVKVKVDASSAPIHIGDLLVTSGQSGIAMKSEPIKVGGRLMHMPGTLIGKALEPLEKGTGEILVLLSLQ